MRYIHKVCCWQTWACSYWPPQPGATQKPECFQHISLANIASVSLGLLCLSLMLCSLLAGTGVEQSKPSLACDTHIIGHFLISWAEVVTPAVFLSLSSAVPKRVYVCSWEGCIWLCLDRKMLVMLFPAWLAGRKTIFTTSTGNIQKDLELNSGQVTACCWMLICSLYKRFRPNCSGNLWEVIFHVNFSALLAQAEMNPGTTKSLKVKNER